MRDPSASEHTQFKNIPIGFLVGCSDPNDYLGLWRYVPPNVVGDAGGSPVCSGWVLTAHASACRCQQPECTTPWQWRAEASKKRKKHIPPAPPGKLAYFLQDRIKHGLQQQTG